MDTEHALGRPYLPRLLDDPLNRALSIAGAVIIEGARATGKTMTALNAAASFAFIDDPANQQLLELSPTSLLAGDAPRLLDEWQLAPALWNLVRREVDASAARGQFILTGSSVPADDVTRHTGAGRFLRLKQRTLTWWEKQGLPSGGVSISSLFQGDRPAASTSAAPDLDDVLGSLLKAGFPAMVDLPSADAALLLRAYADEVTRTDIPRLVSTRQSPDTLRQLLTALARTVSAEATYSTLAADVRSVAPTISADTISQYITVLERLFIVEPQLAWTPSLRSRARLRTSRKLHLVDPALSAALLGANRAFLSRDLETLGLLFESAVIHDLTTYAANLDGELRHYRDSYGNEIDAVLTLPDGRWAVVEVKLGGLQVGRARETLSTAIDQIDTGVVGEPSFRLIITGTGPIATLDEGTVTCPLHHLTP